MNKQIHYMLWYRLEDKLQGRLGRRLWDEVQVMFRSNAKHYLMYALRENWD